MKPPSISLVAGLVLGPMAAAADLHPLFQDHAVLQCDRRVPVWGTGRDGEKVTVTFAGQEVSTVVEDGKWQVWLEPMAPDATPRTLTVAGDTTRVLSDILVGEVWVASGQSNMERRLGLQPGQPPITGWEEEVAAADHPEIRQFHVPQTKSFEPRATVAGSWTVCSPEIVVNFTAVGYFFARDLHLARQVPIGIIHSSWGGTPAEAWTSEAGLRDLPDFAGPLADLAKFAADPEGAKRAAMAERLDWLAKVDPGSRPDAPWSAADLDTADWETMTLPTRIEDAGYSDFDGVFWFRRTFELPENWDGGDAELHLGAVDDMDTTWVNGERVGATDGWDVRRVYTIPGRLLKRGENHLAVRVLDTSGGGGFHGGEPIRLAIRAGEDATAIPLSGEWRCKPGVTIQQSGWPPAAAGDSSSQPTVLYNGMIAPLLPYAIRGVIWYQGESNVGREKQYRTLFPAMIGDWRRAWGQGEFPFLFVQIAPYRSLTPEIREAQLLSWQRTKNTAMVVTLDCGDPHDIHPANKRPVGARLALAARAVAYGENFDYSGPIFESMAVQGGVAVLGFTHTGGGLVAKGGELEGFTIAGADQQFHPAKAEIRGETIVVSAAAVPEPAAVRYAWANVPEGNLHNRAGLPASPFRTDVD